MALLWEQKEMVRVLKEFEAAELKRRPSYGRETLEQLVHETYANPDGFWTWESVLIKEILKRKGTGEFDTSAIRDQQRLLNSCITEGFILEKPNEGFINIFPNPEGVNLNGNYSKRRVRISDDKGPELLSGWYFWAKYVAAALPPVANISISIITAILTSGAIWLFLIKVLKVKILAP